MFLLFAQEHFWSLDETEQRVSPVFMVQIWDNDKFSADDFLGIKIVKIKHSTFSLRPSQSVSFIIHECEIYQYRETTSTCNCNH